MSSESMKLDRQKGLEEKRLKLEKLKKEREERQAASLLLAKNSQNIDKVYIIQPIFFISICRNSSIFRKITIHLSKIQSPTKN